MLLLLASLIPILTSTLTVSICKLTGERGWNQKKIIEKRLAILPYIHGSTSPSNLLSYHLLPYCMFLLTLKAQKYCIYILTSCKIGIFLIHGRILEEASDINKFKKEDHHFKYGFILSVFQNSYFRIYDSATYIQNSAQSARNFFQYLRVSKYTDKARKGYSWDRKTNCMISGFEKQKDMQLKVIIVKFSRCSNC